ncbi:MAG TPA: type II secretion system F family protein, partial [Candidatus Aminicenantes bacterium]|nr:type II secretion system F family protein [Candidatus Aminicenantes bacterium]HPT00906.1 type II secretion system F family protein [Candidatus Aminicenantes bacterium]
MATFVYVGKNKFGQPVKGEKVAASLEEAKRLLNRDQVVVQRIRAKGGIGALMQKFQMKAASVVELAVFTRQMSTIINSGIPLTQGLDIIADQIKNRRFKEIINGVSNDVKSGLSLEDALRKHPDAFSELYVNMAVAGEKSGNLPDILSRLAKYMEREASVKGKIKSAMTYPLVVISVAITITGFILYKVVPTFANLFKDLGAELPLPTQLVVAASDLIVNNIIFIVLGVVGGIFFLRNYYKTYRGRRVLDGILLKMPVMKELLIKGAVARFSRTLSTMISSGIDLLVGLEITARTSGNSIIEDAIMETRNMVTQGRSLSESILGFKVFPSMLGQMVKVGEDTGSLDEMLSKIADFYEEEVDRAVDTLMSLIEPLMITLLGVLIGGIVVALYLP